MASRYRKPNSAHSATPHINTYTTTTENYAPNCAARSARLSFRPIIVLENPSKLNIFVPTANMPCSDGRPSCMSLFINAAMIIVLTASTPLPVSTQRKNFYVKRNHPSLNSATHTANICSRLPISFTQGRSNLPSISRKSITLKTSSASSCPSTSPSPSAQEKPPSSCNKYSKSGSLTRPS